MDRFEQVKERVKEACDLASIVEGYLPLKRSGRHLIGLCPFHDEKTPSFTVNPDLQYFKCYGCGKAGDVYTFVMEREGLDFREAFELLADRVGVSLDGVFGGGRERAPKGPKPHDVLARVRDFCHATLLSPEGQAARNYLASRALDAGIESFKLGFHPTSPGALRRFAQQEKLPLSVLEQAGLIGRGGRESFAGRVIFPIEDERGRVVGFGGRALGDAKPKYLNSPESPFFHKRSVLYGLRHAKSAGDRRIVVMEGYTDVIACHLAGFQGAVATLGTALTREHGKVLARYAQDGVVLLFDGDRAGRAAAEKAYAELARTDLVARIALLSEGMDPADLVTSPAGVEQFDAVIEGAEDALAMWFRLKRGQRDLTQEVHVAAVIDECATVLGALEDPARAAVLERRMAQHLGLDVETFRRSLSMRRKPARRESEREATTDERPPLRELTPGDRADADLLACVLAMPSLIGDALAELGEPGSVGALLELMQAAISDGEVERERLIMRLMSRAAGDGDLARVVALAIDVAARIPEPDSTLAAVLRHRRTFQARSAAQRIRYELQEATTAGDTARIDELTRQYVTQLREQQFG